MVTADQLRELIEIEIANHVEQLYPERAKPELVAGLRRMLTSAESQLSEGARVAFDDLIVRGEQRIAAEKSSVN